LQRRFIALGTAMSESRSARFARRVARTPGTKAPPTLADIVNLPDWILCDAHLTDDIAAVTAMLHFRNAIDRELSGEKLRAICEVVGEAHYDLVCEAPLPPGALLADATAKLPSPKRLAELGRNMLERSLPVAMADQVNRACGDAAMRQLSNMATMMVVAQRREQATVAA
jgi:hypothetical protein